MSADSAISVRRAEPGDGPAIRELIAASSRSLGAAHYGSELIEHALRGVLGLDTQLLRDGTYFLAVAGDTLAGCGGWSARLTLFGSDAVRGRDDRRLDPETEPARIRAFFVHPAFARMGIGSRILARCESEARQAGFRALELGATLSGLEFYRSHGFVAGQAYDYECAPGMPMRIVPMLKTLDS